MRNRVSTEEVTGAELALCCEKGHDIDPVCGIPCGVQEPPCCRRRLALVAHRMLVALS